MTSDRARAYAPAMKTLEDLGPAKLRSPEQALTRVAADSLQFCRNIVADGSARAAVWECGPAFDMALRAA